MTLRDIVFFAGAGFLFFNLMLVFTAFIWFQLAVPLEASPVISSSSDVTSIISSGGSIFNQLDKMAVGYFIAAVLTIILTSWFVSGHPLGMIAYFLGGVMAVIVSMMVSNIWDGLTSPAVLTSTMVNFAFANHLMQNLALYIGIIWFIGLIITYVKPAFFGTQEQFQGGALP